MNHSIASIEKLPIISITILIPIFTAIFIILFAITKNSLYKDSNSKPVALLGSFLTLISSFVIIFLYKADGQNIQLLESYNWITLPYLNIELGVDGFSSLLILLTSILSFLVILFTSKDILKNVNEYLVCLLILESLSISTFASQNILIFYLFFEATIIPVYLLIGIWGSNQKIRSAIKFFLFTFFGSILFLTSLLLIFNEYQTFNLNLLLNKIPLSYSLSTRISCLFIFIALAIKTPIWPLHTWLPDAHVQASTGVSAILSGILLKIGGYGFVKFLIPLYPYLLESYSNIIILLCAIGIIYSSVAAVKQTDIKRVIAFSSIAHMGIGVAGLFSFTHIGFNGAQFQMLSHGIISPGLFMCIGVIYSNIHTKELSKMGGLAVMMPKLSTFMLIILLASIGLPGTSGFIGEILSLQGVFHKGLSFAFICGTSIFLGAVYMLRLYKKSMLGEINENYNNISDLNNNQIITLFIIVFIIIYMGLRPNYIFQYINANTIHIFNHILSYNA